MGNAFSHATSNHISNFGLFQNNTLTFWLGTVYVTNCILPFLLPTHTCNVVPHTLFEVCTVIINNYNLLIPLPYLSWYNWSAMNSNKSWLFVHWLTKLWLNQVDSNKNSPFLKKSFPRWAWDSYVPWQPMFEEEKIKTVLTASSLYSTSNTRIACIYFPFTYLSFDEGFNYTPLSSQPYLACYAVQCALVNYFWWTRAVIYHVKKI